MRLFNGTNYLNYFETSGGQSSNQYLNVFHFFNTGVNKTPMQLKTVEFLHWCLICALILMSYYEKLHFYSNQKQKEGDAKM
jgi:hypothetical protein